jgi:hypothetical protein
MAKIRFTVEGYRCERCRHEWIPRESSPPRVCPHCKSPYWDRPRRDAASESQRVPVALGPGERATFFSMPDAEQLHLEQIALADRELLQIIVDLMKHTYAGFDYITDLPLFDKRDKRSLLASLIARSFTSVNCAMNLAVRGYYVQAITLIRSTLEDDWLFYELNSRPKAVGWMYSGEWPDGRKWEQIVSDIDAAVAKESDGEIEPGQYKELMYRGTYGHLSEIAHPRPRGLRMQFDPSGTRLETGPLMNADGLRTALMYGLNAALAVQLRVGSQVSDVDGADDWRATSERLQADARAWLEARTFEQEGSDPGESTGS